MTVNLHFKQPDDGQSPEFYHPEGNSMTVDLSFEGFVV